MLFLQLVCSVLGFTFLYSVQAQVTATATENGIVSAAGSPEATQSVSYSIIGGGNLAETTGSPTASATPSSTDATIMSGTETGLSDSDDHGLSIPAILGITLAVVLAIVGIIIFAIVMHKRRRQAGSQARRRTILDAEFAGSMTDLQNITTEKSNNIGYFDIAKPLPAVTEKEMPKRPGEEDRLSRSSTIIADAGEVAQINRNASSQQVGHKKSREQQRERHQALQILITNEDNRTSVLHSHHSPLASNSTTPTDTEPPLPWRECSDGNGDPFAKRPSKI